MKHWLKNPYFLTGLFLKIALLWVPGSSYLNDLFIPFLDAAVQSPTSNPWAISPPHYFPYGSVLYAILAVPRFIATSLFGSDALGTSPLGIALIKGPLLAFDLILFSILLRLGQSRDRLLLWFYWLNPIIFFVCYVYGQLDLIAMTFAVASLCYLTKKKITYSAITFAAAALCKFHVVILLPIILVYIWNNEFRRAAVEKIFHWLSLWTVIVAAGFVPLMVVDKFLYATTGSPEANRLFAAKLHLSEDTVLYIGIIIVLTAVVRVCISTRMTAHGLVFGSGAAMASLLLATNPAPGWYVWVSPFVALLFAQYLNIPRVLFWFFQAAYFVYFIGLEYLQPLLPGLASGLTLTVLQSSLGSILAVILFLVLPECAPLSGRARPLKIGLAGDSGAGKNHLSALIEYVFGKPNTLLVEGDNYHRWERGAPEWQKMTHLDPQANALHKLALDADLLGSGLAAYQAHYEHQTGKFTEPQELTPAKTLVLQGLHTFYYRNLRENLDIKIFLQPDEKIRLQWKLHRDTQERGHSIEKVLESLKRREADAQVHIYPQRNYADWIIEAIPKHDVTIEEIINGKRCEIAFRYTLWNDSAIADLLDRVSQLGFVNLKLEDDRAGLERISFRIDGNPTAQQISDAAETLFSNIRHLTRGRIMPAWSGGMDGIHQLFLLGLIQAQIGQRGIAD